MRSLGSFFIFFFAFSNASATVYYIAQSGGNNNNSCASATNINTPKATIMSSTGGLACLKIPGDKLVIRTGSYPETITTNTQAFPTGSSWTSAFTVTNYNGETVTVKGISLHGPLSYWIFDGINVRNDTGYGEGIWTGTTDPANILPTDHLRFMNAKVTTAGAISKSTCIQGNGNFIEFINLEIFGCGDPDVAAGGGAGSGMKYGFYWSGDNGLFEKLKMHDITGFAFHFYNTDCDKGIRGCPDRNVVRYSELYQTCTKSPSYAAIIFAYGDGNQAYGNIIRNNGGKGIAVAYGASNTRLFNNTIYGNPSGGIVNGEGWGINPTRNSLIFNNIVMNNGYYGITNQRSDSGLQVVGSKIQNNIIFGSQNALYDTATDTVKSANLTVDPKLDSAFKLVIGSPAIDAGLNLSTYGTYTDFAGAQRPQGMGFDIGAYEFVSGTQPAIPASPQNLRAQ
jgi:hypothetical protein